MCTLWRLAKEPVFATNDKRPYGIFRRVVIQRDPAVRQEDGQLGPLPIQIDQRFANGRFRRHLIQGFRQPGFQFLDDWPALSCSQGQSFFSGDMLGFFLHGIQAADQAQGLVGAADLAFGLHFLGFHEFAAGVRLMRSSA